MGFYTRNGSRIGKIVTEASGRYDLIAGQVFKFTGGQQQWTTPGTYTFTVPEGVTLISGVVVGAGGGGGVSASPYTGASGGYSSISIGGTTYVQANGGSGGPQNNQPGATGGAGGTVGVTTGGGALVSFGSKAGAAGPTRVNYYVACGGGGAATIGLTTAPGGSEYAWSGSGGTGASLISSGNGSAGGSGDGTSESIQNGHGGAYGGGGAGGRDGMGGGGGALVWFNNFAVTPGSTITIVVGAGGNGAAYTSTQRRGANGASGAVRIIWGARRAYPSTGIGDA